MKYIGWDIEIAVDVPDGVDWKQCRPLGITCASAVADDFTEVWYAGKSENTYNPKMSIAEVQQMANFLKEKSAEYKIVTWNGLSFDFDVMAEESQMKAECIELALNHVDIMYQFFCLKGFPVGINAVAKGSNLPEKIEGMHGDLAPIMWRNKEYEKVIEYNIQDSYMALSAANYIEKHRYISWITQRGMTKTCFMNRLMIVNECKDLPLPDQSWMTNPISKDGYLEWVK